MKVNAPPGAREWPYFRTYTAIKSPKTDERQCNQALVVALRDNGCVLVREQMEVLIIHGARWLG